MSSVSPGGVSPRVRSGGGAAGRGRRSRSRFALPGVLLLGACAALAPVSGSLAGEGIEVTFLVNGGFLVQSGSSRLLIDAFVEEGDSAYGALTGEAFRSMVAGEPPFDSIPLALTSHVHYDHFQPAAAREFLRGHPETRFASSPEVIGALLENWPEADRFSEQVRRVWPDEGQSATFTAADIHVEFLRLSHEASMFYPEQVLGHLIRIGGRTLLHLGDAETRISRFAPYKLETRDVDVAFVPNWLFKTDEGRAILRDRIAAKKLVVMHLPEHGREEILAAIFQQFPDVVVFEKPGQTLRF